MEQKVVDEVLGVLRSPEIVMNVERIAEWEAVHKGKHDNFTTASLEISKQNLILALRNLTEVWSFLYPTEQQKIVSMLTDEVLLADDGIKIMMNLEGFDHVMMELSV